MTSVEALWADFATPIATADDYISRCAAAGMNVFFMGERVPEPVDHPVIRPSINAMAETYRIATERPELATVRSEIGGLAVNRFLHVPTSPDDLVAKHEMQRELGRRTGTCFQRCVGLDAISTCHSVTFDIDGKSGTDYHRRFLSFLRRAQAANVVIGGAMTDPKGDRSKAPHQQSDPDLFLHVTRRDDNGIYVSGAKMHQTGAVNSHWLIFMPTMRMTEADRDWAVVGAVRVDAPGLTYVVGRQTNDTRVVDGGAMDAGNAQFAGQESLIVFEDVFVPHEHVFMDGEWAYASIAGRALHDLSSLVLRLQNRTGRRADRGRRVRRRAQRRRGGVAHQGQARRDDASQRDDLLELHGGGAPVEAGGVGRLYQRRDAVERRQAQRHAVPVRNRAAGPGHRRRADRDHAVREGPAEQRGRPADPQVPARPRRRRGRPIGCASCA